MTRRIVLILAVIIWIGSLLVLIIALTDIYPNNPFKDYRFLIGIAFISVSGLLQKYCLKNKNV